MSGPLPWGTFRVYMKPSFLMVPLRPPFADMATEIKSAECLAAARPSTPSIFWVSVTRLHSAFHERFVKSTKKGRWSLIWNEVS